MNDTATKPAPEMWGHHYSSSAQALIVHYSYQTPDGKRFECNGRTLNVCRRKRDHWLALSRQAPTR